jgi:N-acetylmuramoyl-L-alanine amidase
MKIFLLTISVLVSGSLAAQKILNYNDYKELAKYNLSYLDKGGVVKLQRVKFKERDLELYDEKGANEFSITWPQVPQLVRRLETGDHKDLYGGMNKSLKDLSGGLIKQGAEYHPIPTEMADVVVAIDPGHFAKNFTQAIREDKYVKMHGADLGVAKDINFYEADLADITAAIAKLELEKLGARAFLTKGMGENSLGKSFHDWYVKDYKGDLQKYYNDGDVTKTDYETYLHSDSNALFNTFYRFVEFRKRIDLINSSDPTMTIIIHYNAAEGGKRDADGFLKPVQKNYSMAFVPGAFSGYELRRYAEKLDFLRLLMSPDLNKSMRLAHLILEQENLIGVPPVQNDQHVLDERYCSRTDYDGVYCRNLAMTRTVRGPLVYLEALLQDNEKEAVELAKRDYAFDHPSYGKMMVPKRCYEVAMCIVKGVTNWLEENKSYSSISAPNTDSNKK